MSLRLIVGKPGTGKTTLCCQEILAQQKQDENNALIFMVPEQFSLQAESDLIQKSCGRGLVRAQVLSFGRLAYRVFAELGGNNKPTIEEVGKQMLLKKLLLQWKDQLLFYATSVDKPGFVEHLSEMISELYQYQIFPDALLQLIAEIEKEETVKQGLLLKLQDLYTIYVAYKKWVEDHYLSTDATLDLMYQKMERSKFLLGAEIWIDGFFGFTPQEYRIVSCLLRLAKRVNIAIVADSVNFPYKQVFSTDLFFETKSTINHIIALAQEEKVQIEPPVFLETMHRFAQFPRLAHLALQFGLPNKKNFEGNGLTDEASNQMVICHADNLYLEVHNAARCIVDLAFEKNFRYKEIAILVTDLDRYEKTIKALFPQYNIPVYIDAKRDILSHPLTEFLRAGLDILIFNWPYESVFRLLKTNMTKMDQNTMDQLENYVLAVGIKREKWFQPFVYGFAQEDETPLYEDFHEETMNEARLLVLKTMEPLLMRFGQNATAQKPGLLTLDKTKKYTVSAICEGLYDFMVANDIVQTIETFVQESLKAGETEEYLSHGQIFGKVIGILDKLVDIFGNDELTLKEFANILDSGFSGTKMGLVPPSLDQIIVGDLRRSRLQKVKALLVLGLNENMQKQDESGILTDEERKTMSKTVQLGKNKLAKAYEDEFLLYSALTKPSHFLMLSCYLGGLDGKVNLPATILGQMETMFAMKPKLVNHLIPNEWERVSVASGTWGELTGSLRELVENQQKNSVISPVFSDVYAYFLETKPYQEKIERMKQSVGFLNQMEALSVASVESLYGKYIKSSVSKLESFVRCPFAYFAQYNLKAKERKLYEVQNLDLGNMFHQVLDSFSRLLQQEGLTWGCLSESNRKQLAGKAIEAAISSNELFSYSAQYKYFANRVATISDMSLKALSSHMKSGSFKLAFTEAAFLDTANILEDNICNVADQLGSIEVGLESGRKLLLEGRIDRIDLAEIKDSQYVKIIDYKSSYKKFSLAEIFYGLQLQLVVYMDSFLKKYKSKNNAQLLPAAVFYFVLQNPVIAYHKELLQNNLTEEEWLKAYKMSGVVLAEEEVVKAIDGEMEKKSNVMNVAIKKAKNEDDFSLTANSSALSLEHFQKLMQFSMNKVKEIGDQIATGEISASPFQYKNQKGCTYCPYRSICRFDGVLHSYRNMKPFAKDKDVIGEM